MTCNAAIKVAIVLSIVSAALNWYIFFQSNDASPLSSSSHELDFSQTSGILNGSWWSREKQSNDLIGGPMGGAVPSHSMILLAKNDSIETTTATTTTTKTSTTKTSTTSGNNHYNPQEYERLLQETLIPLPDSQVNTTNHIRHFMAGLCNQYQRFLGTVLLAHKNGYGQIIEESVTWKDTFGTDAFVYTSKLWDIVHWNSFYPTLPRFARYDKNIHTDLAIVTNKKNIGDIIYEWNETKYNVSTNHDIWNDVTHPPPLGQHPNQGEIQYRQLMKLIDHGKAHKSRPEEYEMYTTILKGALRPHPILQGIIDKTATSLGGTNKNGFMVIHARVEPDMARQQVCTDKKVYFMDNITDMIYRQFPEPPVETVLIVFARSLLERMEENAQRKRRGRNHLDKVNKHNLDSIHNLLENGMWGGKVKVIEAGSELVQNDGDLFYRRFSNIAGGIVNFFLAVQSKILVGTEVSTFSTLSMNTRFYREERENYFYRPDGLHSATPPDSNKPHRFVC